VYAEQRGQLETQKARETTKGRIDEDELLTMYANPQRQVSEYRS